MNWKLVVICLLVVGLSSWGFYEEGFFKGKKFVNDANQVKITEQLKDSRKKEGELFLSSTKVAQAYQEGLIDGDKKAKVLVDSILNGSLRLSDSSCPVPKNPTSTSKPDDSSGCQLSVSVTKHLFDLTREAERNTEQLNGCIRYIEELQKWGK